MLQDPYWLYGCLAVLGGAALGRLCCRVAERTLLRLQGKLPAGGAHRPLAQLLGVLLLFSLWLRFSWSWQLVKWLVLACLLLMIGLVDFHSFLIPDGLLLWGLALYMPLALLEGQPWPALLWSGLLGGCSVALPLALFVLLADAAFRQETMGGGDLKLLFLLGVYLGPLETGLTLFAACVIGLFWQGLHRSLRRGQPFPFGPALAVAAWLVVLWGPQVSAWYLTYLL